MCAATAFRIGSRLVIPVLVITFSFNDGLAQSDAEEITTDRPDITESAIVVPKSSLQAENGLTWTKGRGDALVLCQTLLRLGVTDRTELRLFLPSYVQSFSRATGSSGLTDISIGFKQQVGPLPGGLDLSLIVATSAPSGSSDKTTHRLDPFLKIPWSRELGNGWSVGGMASRLAGGPTPARCSRQSSRKASVGLTFEALQAGMNAAASAPPARISAAAATVAGSVAVTPNNCD